MNLADEFAADDIRVIGLAPGMIGSRAVLDRLEQHHKDLVLSTQLLKRFGTPDDVAGVVLFLCSPEASFHLTTKGFVPSLRVAFAGRWGAYVRWHGPLPSAAVLALLQCAYACAAEPALGYPLKNPAHPIDRAWKIEIGFIVFHPPEFHLIGFEPGDEESRIAGLRNQRCEWTFR